MATDKKVTFGEIEVALLAAGLMPTIEAFGKLETGVWKAVASANKLTVDPWHKDLLRPVLLGLVQGAWYEAFEGKIPELCVKNQTSRLSRFNQQLNELKNADGKDVLVKIRKPKADGTPAAPRIAKTYVLVAGAVLPESGQRFIVADTLAENDGKVGGTGMTVLQVFEKQAKYKGIISPAQNNVAFHMNAFAKEGLIQEIKDGKLQGTIPVEKEPDEKKTPKVPKEKTPPVDKKKK